jgi:formate dehydrogenase subunit gamma
MVRHEGIDRLYHWLMAASVLTLLGTAFLPVLGVTFAWVTIHWIAGVVLAVLVLFHIVRGLAWSRLRLMWFGWRDFVDLIRESNALFGPATAPRVGKYSPAQKLYHYAVVLIVLSLVITGLFMLAKLDTPFWQRNPYFLDSATWGVIYVIHGYAAMTLITVLIAHIYFAVRPEKLWLTRSMIRGWITRGEYATHFDAARWPTAEDGGESEADEAGKSAGQHSAA